MKKRALALALGLTLCLGTMSIASAETPIGEIGGDSDLTEVIFEVGLPTNLNYSLDPFEIGGNGQFDPGTGNASNGYTLVNKTPIAVKVLFNLVVTPAEGVALVADATAAKADPTAKNAFMNVITAATIQGTAPLFASGFAPWVKDTDYAKFDTAVTASIIPFDTTTSKAAFGFMLAAPDLSGGVGSEVLATANAGVAAFKFHGTLNPAAAWAAGDLDVGGYYNLRGVSAADYTAEAATDLETTALNLILTSKLPAMAPAATPVPTPVPYGFTAVTGEFLIKQNAVPETTTLKLEASDSILKVEMLTKGTQTVFYTLIAKDYTYVAGTQILTFLKNATTPTSVFKASSAYAQYDIKVTTNGGKVYTMAIKYSAS